MRPFKASLFLIYCLLGTAATGATFSHFWRVKTLLDQEEANVKPPPPQPSTDELPVEQPTPQP